MDQTLFGIAPGTTSAVDPTSAYPVAGQAGAAIGTGTAQHGVIPVVTGIGSGAMGAVGTVWDWLNTPFNKGWSPATIFVVVGSILIAIILWNIILYHIRIAAEAI